ncbi:MAG: DegT/DnrJ/EryC1/StrS family aminotransferase, partial [Nitrospirota bacterium]|nr:DegT/DnrJ/EryC1/StrS family aminotransferase [Nitrospirota bacterium]
LHQLARVEASLAVRERHWQAYDAAFADLQELVETPCRAGANERHARHLYTVLLRTDRLTIDREQFMKALRAENIGTGVHFVPVHLHSYYRDRYGFGAGTFPIAEDIGARTISLPLSARVSDTDVEDVIAAVRKVVTHYVR